jgi:hypothetical protein
MAPDQLVQIMRSDCPAALATLERAIELSRRLGDRFAEAECLT